MGSLLRVGPLRSCGETELPSRCLYLGIGRLWLQLLLPLGLVSQLAECAHTATSFRANSHCQQLVHQLQLARLPTTLQWPLSVVSFHDGVECNMQASVFFVVFQFWELYPGVLQSEGMIVAALLGGTLPSGLPLPLR